LRWQDALYLLGGSNVLHGRDRSLSQQRLPGHPLSAALVGITSGSGVVRRWRPRGWVIPATARRGAMAVAYPIVAFFAKMEVEVLSAMVAAMSSRWRRQERAVDSFNRAGGGRKLGCLFLQESSGFLCFPFLWRFFHRNHDSCSAGIFSEPPRKSCLYGPTWDAT